MKRINLILAGLLFALTTSAQKAEEVTMVAPMGTYFKGNKLMLKKGYVAEPVKDKNILLIKAKRASNSGDGSTTVAVRCYCLNSGSCQVVSGSEMVYCQEGTCEVLCKMSVISGNSLALMLNDDEADDKDIKWQRLVFPTKSN